MEEDFSRYNGEGTVLGKAQERMLQIMVQIDRICRKNDIPYWLDFGTLLGAVRHGGFIPWDDDMDIAILRKDRKRFCRCMKEQLPDEFRLFDNKTVKYFSRSGIIKVMDCRSKVVEKHQDESELSQGYGLWVDVFCIEKGNVKFRRKMNETHGRFIRRMQGIVDDGEFNKTLSYLLYPITNSIIAIYRLIHRMSRSTHYIYDLKSLMAKALYSKRELSQIFPLQEIEFAGHTFMAPAQIEAFLEETYHDYMALPPEESRVTHIAKIEIN